MFTSAMTRQRREETCLSVCPHWYRQVTESPWEDRHPYQQYPDGWVRGHGKEVTIPVLTTQTWMPSAGWHPTQDLEQEMEAYDKLGNPRESALCDPQS